MVKKLVAALAIGAASLLGLGGVAHAAPNLGAPDVIGQEVGKAKDKLKDAGYKPVVISRNGGGQTCVVFHQATRSNDRVSLAINCRNS